MRQGGCARRCSSSSRRARTRAPRIPSASPPSRKFRSATSTPTSPPGSSPNCPPTCGAPSPRSSTRSTRRSGRHATSYARARFLLTIQLNDNDPEVVGAALFELGLVPDLELLADPALIRTRTGLNVRQMRDPDRRRPPRAAAGARPRPDRRRHSATRLASLVAEHRARRSARVDPPHRRRPGELAAVVPPLAAARDHGHRGGPGSSSAT